MCIETIKRCLQKLNTVRQKFCEQMNLKKVGIFQRLCGQSWSIDAKKVISILLEIFRLLLKLNTLKIGGITQLIIFVQLLKLMYDNHLLLSVNNDVRNLPLRNLFDSFSFLLKLLIQSR